MTSCWTAAAPADSGSGKVTRPEVDVIAASCCIGTYITCKGSLEDSPRLPDALSSVLQRCHVALSAASWSVAPLADSDAHSLV